MKKSILINCSLLLLTIALAAVSVSAQTLGSYRAEIPFDFTVGNVDYAAGDYAVRLESPNYLATILRLSNGDGKELLVSAVTRNGNPSKDKVAKLVFDRYGEFYVMNRISAPRFAFTAPKTDTKSWMYVSKNLLRKPETVSIVLAR